MKLKKKLMLAMGIFALMTSCMPKHAVYVSLLDYRPAAEIYGVKMTESDAVNFDYEPIGSIVVVEQSGEVSGKKIETKENTRKALVDDIYRESEPKKKEYAQASGESIIKYVAQAAKEAGGDYVLNLNIQRDLSNKNSSTIIATGMVVKRK